MATKYFVNGGVNNNWSSTSNWSTSSGGSGGQAIPTISDDVVLDSNSPNCIIDTSGRVCKTLTCTGFTGNLTLNAQLNVSGNIVLSGTMTIPPSTFRLQISASGASITSNGCIINSAFAFQATNGIFTLNDDMYVTGLLTLFGAIGTGTINGNKIHVRGNVSFGSNSTYFVGTTQLLFDGTSTITTGSNTCGLDFIINTSGSVTFTNGAMIRMAGNFTYVTGTVITTGSNITFGTFINTCNINSAGMIWDSLTFQPSSSGLTCTLSSTLTASGTITYLPNGVNNNTIMSGNYGWVCDTLSLGSSSNLTLVSGVTYTVNTCITRPASSGVHCNLMASISNGAKAILTFRGIIYDARFQTITDIDASNGNPLKLVPGSITRCYNILDATF